MGALSAIDIALWDIAGKYFGVPCYQLMGGKCRDKARVYYWVFGNSKEELIQGCISAKNAGFTAVGHLTPFLDEPREVPYFTMLIRWRMPLRQWGATVKQLVKMLILLE